jgi:hypothetical protein
MQIQVEGLPDGQYDVELVSAEQMPPPEENPEWGDSVQLTVMVVGGVHDGQLVSDRLGLKLSKKARFGKLLRGIIRRDPVPGENLDLSRYYGNRYKLLVEVNEGRTRFLSFVAIPDDAA